MSQAHEMTVPVLLGHYVNQSNQATLWQQRAAQEEKRAVQAEEKIKELEAELEDLKPKADPTPDDVPGKGPSE